MLQKAYNFESFVMFEGVKKGELSRTLYDFSTALLVSCVLAYCVQEH